MSAPVFTGYQKSVIALLAFLQFTIVLDFMIIGPLGALLLRDLGVSTSQFGLVVSSYAFSAGISGILAAGFADKFDRKKLLLFFYGGFVLGTFLCGIATSYAFLLVGRIVTGLFGGVVGSVAMAIIADLFPMQVRGRVMGFVQTAFAASQVLGLPLGLIASNRWDWHAPFLIIVGVSAAVGVVIVIKLRPIREHLEVKSARPPFAHLLSILRKGRYLQAFAAMVLLATGGFMLMPFASAFSVNNIGLSLKDDLPKVYFATGVASMIAGPLIGKLSDKIGKYLVFCMGSVLGIVLVLVYCNLGLTPLGKVIALNIMLFIAITARIISSQALASGVPDMQDRGAFMAINNSVSQLAGGLAAATAGLIVVQTASGRLEHYDTLGWVVATAMAVAMGLMYPVHRIVMRKLAEDRSKTRGPGAGPGAPILQPAGSAQ